MPPSSCDSAVHEGNRHGYWTLRLLAVCSRFRIAGSPCAQQRERCFGSYECLCAAERQNLRNLLQRKVEEEGNLESQNDIGFEEMAALKHSLKIALHVYDALQNSRCFACRRSIPTEERRNIGLGYFKYGLCAGCFEALTIVCTEQDDTLAEQHAAAMLLSANTEQVQNVVCRKHMQLGSAMSLRIVRTSCLICFVKCHDGQPGFQRDKLSSLSCQCGPKKLPKA